LGIDGRAKGINAVPLHLYSDGFGEFEAAGRLGGQDDLLLSGVGRSSGSRTGTALRLA